MNVLRIIDVSWTKVPPACTVLIGSLSVHVVGRVGRTAENDTFFLWPVVESLLVGGTRVFSHVIGQLLRDTVHDNVETTSRCAQLHHCALDVDVAAVLVIVGSAIVGATDEVAFAANLDGTGVMSPVPIDVKVLVLVLVALCQFMEGGVDVSSWPSHHSGAISAQNQQVIAVNRFDWGTSRCDRCG